MPDPLDLPVIRDAVGAIGLAVSMLREGGAPWLRGVPRPEQVRIRAILEVLASATDELVGQVALDAEAIAVETARALREHPAAIPEPAANSAPVHAELLAVARRLEVVTAIQPPPRPLLALDIEADATLPIEPDRLLAALHAAIIGLVRSRPVTRQPWTVTLRTRNDSLPHPTTTEHGTSTARSGTTDREANDRGAIVVVELRCEVADDSIARGPAVLPPWLHGCLELAESCGGGLTRGRDGTHEVVRMILPAVPRPPHARDTEPGAPRRPASRRVA